MDERDEARPAPAGERGCCELERIMNKAQATKKQAEDAWPQDRVPSRKAAVAVIVVAAAAVAEEDEADETSGRRDEEETPSTLRHQAPRR